MRIKQDIGIDEILIGHDLIVRVSRRGNGEVSIADRTPPQPSQRTLSGPLISLALAHDLLERAARRALIDVPSSAAMTRISRRSAESSFSVILDFILRARKYV